MKLWTLKWTYQKVKTGESRDVEMAKLEFENKRVKVIATEQNKKIKIKLRITKIKKGEPNGKTRI